MYNKQKALTLLALNLLVLVACRQPEADHHCHCIDGNENSVVDTIYHTESDQAYQLCKGNEGVQNNWSCTSSKL